MDALLASPADWISPQNDGTGGDYVADPPAADGRKVIISDTDHLDIGAGPTWVWLNERGRKGSRAAPIVKRLVAELVEEGRLLPARVEGWPERERAYLHPEARVPRRIDARGIVTPFDSLVWERDRIARLFGMQYSIEIYTPPAKRVYGYYVCPFLLGDTLVARCDLKADRQRRVLMVPGAFLEPGQQARRVAPALAAELEQLRDWLGLDKIEVGRARSLLALNGVRPETAA